MLTLYQFPNSHYCEKVRWALDYKHLDYQVKNLLPGLHGRKAKKLAGSSSLPILVHDGKALQNSSDILTYLDEVFPQSLLTPEQESLKQEALAFEKFADEEIGIPVRMVFYHTLLEHPALLVAMFTGNGPWYGPLILKAFFPKLKAAMRSNMRISDETAEAAHVKLALAIDKVYDRLQGKRFLVGDSFTRADLATAALLAPLCRPKKYGVDWPQPYPEPLEAIIARYAEKIAWVEARYAEYR